MEYAYAQNHGIHGDRDSVIYCSPTHDPTDFTSVKKFMRLKKGYLLRFCKDDLT